MATAWERLATFEGGSVADLAAARVADGSWHVFAATAVGVFRSVDQGQTWEALMPAVAAVEVVAPSPTFAQDGILYLGANSGLYRWDGRHGHLAHLLSGAPVQTMTVMAADAADATIFVGTEHDGILVSRDGGRIWEGANAGLLDLCVEGIALSPTFSEDGVAFAATIDGLYRTRNGGEAWRALSLDLDEDDVVVSCVAVSPTFADDRIVLAGTEDYGLLRSDDGGRSWSRPSELSDHLINRITYLDGGRVIAALDGGLALSDDDGQNWTKVGGDLGGVAAVALIPGAPDVLLAALPESGAQSEPGLTYTGVARSTDGGVSWAASNVGLAAHLFVGLTLIPRQEHEPLVALSSLDWGVHIWSGAGSTRTAWIEASEPRIVPHLALARPSAQSARLVAVAESRLITAQVPDQVTGSLDWQDAWPDVDQVQTLGVAGDGSAVVAGQTHADCRVSLDGGTSWSTLALPEADDGSIVGLAIAPVHVDRATVYVARVEHSRLPEYTPLSVWCSLDGGRQWRLWLQEPEVPAGSAVKLLALPRNSFGDSVALAVGNQVFRPRPNAWETKAGVRRPVWDAVTLTDDTHPAWPMNVSGLAASPAYAQDRTLFAATSAGVFVSRDGAATWSHWSDGLEPAATVAVAVSPAYDQDRLVYALGLGGSVWRRQDR